MSNPVTFNMQDQKTLDILTLVGRGGCSVAQAAQLLGISVRHLRRLQRRYEE